MVGRMNSSEVFEAVGEKTIRARYAPYVAQQLRVDSETFWRGEAERLGVELLDARAMCDLYDLARAKDLVVGRLQHCAYFRKPK